MTKRLLLLLCLVTALLFSGCWNYRSLDEINIVVGIAIDFDDATNEYVVNYELVNLSGSGNNQSLGGRIVESRGNTLFDAARQAKRTEADKLFFGSAEVLILSDHIARETGILNIIEWFMRDGECRETMYIMVSQEKTAADLLKVKGEELASTVLFEIVREESKTSASSVKIEIYRVYNVIKSRNALMLPAFRIIDNNGEKLCQINGVAIFGEEKLLGYLPEELAKFVHFIENEMKAGLITLSVTGMKTNDVTLEIFENKTKKYFDPEGDKLRIKIETNTKVALGENQSYHPVDDPIYLEKIKCMAEDYIEQGIKQVVKLAQETFNADFVGFGEDIYKKDYKLWRELQPRWNQIFRTLEVEVESKVRIINAAESK